MILLFGLSKERPILGHHAKAHIFEIRRISCEIHPKPYKIRCFNKNSSVWGGGGGVQGGGYDPGFHVKSAGFHEIERPLARNCNPMFWILSTHGTDNGWLPIFMLGEIPSGGVRK